MKKLLFVLLLASPAFGQGSFYALPTPMPNATVRVCTVPPNGNPCSGLASIFANQNLTGAIGNPFTTGADGNFGFWVASGQYVLQVGPPFNQSIPITLGGGGGGSGTVNSGTVPNFPQYSAATTLSDSGIPMFLNPLSYQWFYDDFVGGPTVSSQGAFADGAMGLAWFQQLAGSGTTGPDISNTAGTSGTVTMTTGATSGNQTNLYAAGGAIAGSWTPIGATTFDYRARIAIPTTTTVTVQAGFYDDSGNNDIIIRYDTSQSDTTWTLETKKAGVASTAVITGSTLDTNFHDLRIRSTTAGTILGSVDGGTEVSLATNVPTGQLQPQFSVITRTTAARTLRLDFVWGWIAINR